MGKNKISGGANASKNVHVSGDIRISSGKKLQANSPAERSQIGTLI